MFEVELFLGLEIDEAMQKQLDRVDPERLALFFNSEEEKCLHEAAYEQKRYIGKAVGYTADLAKLELLELNIWSLLKKLIGPQKRSDAVFELFPINVRIPR